MQKFIRHWPVWCLVLAALTTGGCNSARPTTPGPRLYVLDCGTIGPMDPTSLGLAANEVDGATVQLAAPCYLIVHPKGTLIWDVGHIPDAAIPDDGTEVVQHGVLRATRRLGSQLAGLGYAPEDIDYVAMSHHHIDHTGNANAFAGSTWIVQQAEYDVMFSDASTGSPESYRELEGATRITLNDADHDVFADGSVVVKSAPGHTAGHQALFLQLRNTGPIFLTGDLYHLLEQQALDPLSTYEFDSAKTRATRRNIDAFIARTHAQMWIQHDPRRYASLRKSPQFYD